MKTLWAPWRMEFIHDAVKRQKNPNQKYECPFCVAQKGKPSVTNLVLYRGKNSFIIMNKYPYSNGHLMVIPNRHIDDFSKLKKVEHAELGQLLALAKEALSSVMNCHGFNIGMNLGEIAGAGIKDHIHYHIVPRWNADHNFMPIFAEVKVIPEHFKTTYRNLKKYFDKSLKS